MLANTFFSSCQNISFGLGLFRNSSSQSHAALANVDKVTCQILSEDQREIQHEARRAFESMIDAGDREKAMTRSLWKELGDMGFLGVVVPEEYGGSDLGVTEQLLIMEEISRLSPSVGLAYAAHSSLCIDRILMHGNTEQKAKYLPKLVSGENVGALCLTEVGAGSDVASLRTTATKVDGGWQIDGGKTFVTNGLEADIFVAYAKTSPEKGHRGITAFIVESKWDGVSKGPKFDKLGMRGSSTCEVFFDNVFLPEANVLGDVDGGVYVLMKGLDSERLILSGGPVGIIQGCMDYVLPYVNERQQFGKKIADFELIQAKIADIYTSLLSSRLYSYQVAKAFDKGRGVHLSQDCAGVYLYAAEAASKVATQALQTFGGYGYTKDFPLEMFFRDSKLYEIGGGTSEIRRILIGRRLAKSFE